MKVEIRKLPVSRKVSLIEATNCHSNLADKPEMSGQGITEAYINQFKADILAAENFKTSKNIQKEKAAWTVLLKVKIKACQKWLKRGEFYLELAFQPKSSQGTEYPVCNRQEQRSVNGRCDDRRCKCTNKIFNQSYGKGNARYILSRRRYA